jgi:hypothetical protein
VNTILSPHLLVYSLFSSSSCRVVYLFDLSLYFKWVMCILLFGRSHVHRGTFSLDGFLFFFCLVSWKSTHLSFLSFSFSVHFALRSLLPPLSISLSLFRSSCQPRKRQRKNKEVNEGAVISFCSSTFGYERCCFNRSYDSLSSSFSSLFASSFLLYTFVCRFGCVGGFSCFWYGHFFSLFSFSLSF